MWDKIIDYHDQSPNDLKSFIVVNTKIQANRLIDFLSSSPHLIPWSHLDALWLGHYSSRSQGPDLEKRHRLVGIPSVHWITFQGDRWEAEHLLSVFAHCTSGLDRVDFCACDAVIPVAAPPLSPAARRPVIRHVALMESPEIAALLTDPACPLDCHTLAYFNSGLDMSPAIDALRLQSRSTIETLHFESTGTCIAVAPRLTDPARIELLDISVFPALKFLKCDPPV
ncbi:hypothetical protein B0H17DRAFT_1211377 [Mycena rosella]|uniref:Uncharacterized protein n=1 Tax=Mycena rosella TaxID=1033263 RepID=A0AAD7CUA0_MYCRO|nr:hypothetical protein B0H17DRAFT_1211377 [Mycena rosella]